MADQVGGFRMKLPIDRLQHTDQVRVDLIIPEPQHLEAALCKNRIASPVAIRVSVEIVLTAIQLDDEVLTQADEIDNVMLAWSLPSEMIAA